MVVLFFSGVVFVFVFVFEPLWSQGNSYCPEIMHYWTDKDLGLKTITYSLRSPSPSDNEV